jgi:hypothetical protein
MAQGLWSPARGKQHYRETWREVQLRRQQVFADWKRLGLQYMLLGLEALDGEDLQHYGAAGAGACQPSAAPKLNICTARPSADLPTVSSIRSTVGGISVQVRRSR